MDYIILAIPVFFLLIGIELAFATLTGRHYYRLNDSVNDLSCGILQQLLGVFLKTVLFAGYVALYESHRVFSLPASSAVVWVTCFLGVDFLYYWFHRTSHERGALWAAHVVHHQSEEFNLAVALRQSAFQASFSWVFYLPLAVLGFPPLVFLTVSSFNTLYQFWIHTRAIGRLGPLEWVLNTPSNHRVHHGREPKYIDRNHGGTLIVWDRLFGTYQREEEEPVYGITTPLRSWNPVWANLHYWVELARTARQARRPLDRLRPLWKAPGWRPAELGGFRPAPEVDRSRYRKFDVPVPRGLGAYVLIQFLPVLVGTAVLLRLQDELPRGAVAAGAGLVAFSLVSLGALLEGRSWAVGLEGVRVLALTLVGLLAGGPRLGVPGGAAAALAGAGLLLWLTRYRGLRSEEIQT